MTADASVIRVTDLDLNGFFDAFFDLSSDAPPSHDPRLRPSSALVPIDGFAAWPGEGVPGHMLHVWRNYGEDGLLAALGLHFSSGPDGRAEFVLDLPFVAGTFVQILDLDNDTLSEPYAVVPPAPAIYRAIGNAGPGMGGTIVFQRGVLLESLGITGVLVGDVPALAFEVRSGGVEYTTPPNDSVPGNGVIDKALHVDVRFLYAGGPPIPKAIWNNIGMPARLGAMTLPSSPAPTTFFSRPGGLGMAVTFTVQGLILDSASLQGQAAVTNAVVVIAE